MSTTSNNNEQEHLKEATQAKKGDTKELDLSELKKALAIEEAELEQAKRLNRLEQQKEQMKATIIEEDSAVKPASQESQVKSTEKMNPQDLRDARRKYWQEKQKQEERKRKPYHSYPTFFYTGFWFRLFAFLIDLLVISSINRLIVQPLFLLLRYPLNDDAFSAFSLSKLAIYLLYFVLVTKLTNGQTIGKIIFGIRVVSFKEEKLSWATVIIRECFSRYILKVFPFIYLMVLFTQEKQHLGDFFSDTSVVSENLIRANQLSFEKQ
ncbi:putative integral inner membrane protein [Carnobacterium sp. 17-4]|uniref:RDD family protein n=1 Tax=Carnobacterium sp. (strain 17-4) TaxID=208596 RepID=UPI000205932A|nr:RDD family protein [Carnobacterium sp. 17-4]AEB29837.1 putative integral inner membrane protein [Carnobacterium sp. 17-4]